MLKLKIIVYCVMMLPLMSVAHQSSLSVSREATTASGVDINAASRLADTAERDYFTLRRLITMQKQLEGTQKYINEQCR